MISLLDRDVVFFGGKGGVGKTTCSSAFALAASRRGRRVLLVSTDPAHSTSDIFERRIGPEEREIEPRLFALEIDAEREASRYVARREARHRAHVRAGRHPSGASADRHGCRVARPRGSGAARSHDRSDRLSRVRRRPHRVRHGADRTHAAAAAHARSDGDVDPGAAETSPRRARNRSGATKRGTSRHWRRRKTRC